MFVVVVVVLISPSDPENPKDLETIVLAIPTVLVKYNSLDISKNKAHVRPTYLVSCLPYSCSRNTGLFSPSVSCLSSAIFDLVSLLGALVPKHWVHQNHLEGSCEHKFLGLTHKCVLQGV